MKILLSPSPKSSKPYKMTNIHRLHSPNSELNSNCSPLISFHQKLSYLSGETMDNNGSRKRQFVEPVDDPDDDQLQPTRKRQPSLFSVVRGAMLAETIKGICSSLEPMIRKVVHDEVQQIVCGHNPLYGVPQYYLEQAIPVLQSQQLRCEEMPTHKLVFANQVAESIYTNNKVTGTDNNQLKIELIDINTGQVCSNAAPIKVKIVVIDGDLEPEGLDSDRFNGKIVKPREGKRPLLVGNTDVTLNGGIGITGDMVFTDNSKSLRCGKFRLGVCVDSECCGTAIKIQEGLSEKFAVKDHRGELYKKHYPPMPDDDVWRLEKIAKDGTYHERLKSNNINSVQGFLEMLNANPTDLKKKLEMPINAWDKVVKHARTCPMGLNSANLQNNANLPEWSQSQETQSGAFGNGQQSEAAANTSIVGSELRYSSPMFSRVESFDIAAMMFDIE